MGLGAMELRVHALLTALLVLWQHASGQHVVGPGGVTPYSGGGARRSGGYGYVRDPAEGFFVAGSSIKELNGVYKRVEKVPSAIPHQFHYAYRKWPYGTEDNMRSWHMALVKSPGPDDGYEAVGPHDSEWLFIDSDHRDRFGHEGATVIPGSGTDWVHLHRKGRQGAGNNPNAIALSDDDDFDELPWQIIFIGDAEQVEKFRKMEEDYEENIRQKVAGTMLPAPAMCGDGVSQRCPSEESPPTDVRSAIEHSPVVAALEAFAERRFSEAAALYAAERAKNCPACTTTHSRAWRIATLHLREAECHRRARAFVRSLTSSNAALKIAPRYTAALRERGLAMIDAGRPGVAIRVFETLLRQERTFAMTATTADGADVDSAQGYDSVRSNPRTGNMLGLLLLAHGRSTRANEAALKSDSQPALAPGSGEEHAADDGGAQVFAAGAAPDAVDDFSITLDELIAAPPISLRYTQKRSPVVDHYAVLGLAVDFAEEELRQAYKKMSKLHHPDRPGGTDVAFQLISAANSCLSDEDCRAAYDEGEGTERQVLSDGSEGPTLKERVERHYFPERYDLRLFGDPYERKRRWQEREQPQRGHRWGEF